MASALLFLLCQHKKTQNDFNEIGPRLPATLTQGVSPKRSPNVLCWAKQGSHAFPFTVSAPAAMFSPPETPGMTMELETHLVRC